MKTIRPYVAPSNWELISRSLLPLLNGHRGPSYAVAEPEVKPVVLAVAKLKICAHLYPEWKFWLVKRIRGVWEHRELPR